jgi:hypothetical protein
MATSSAAWVISSTGTLSFPSAMKACVALIKAAGGLLTALQAALRTALTVPRVVHESSLTLAQHQFQ